MQKFRFTTSLNVCTRYTILKSLITKVVYDGKIIAND